MAVNHLVGGSNPSPGAMINFGRLKRVRTRMTGEGKDPAEKIELRNDNQVIVKTEIHTHVGKASITNIKCILRR